MQRKTPQTSDIDDETLFAKVEQGRCRGIYCSLQ